MNQGQPLGRFQDRTEPMRRAPPGHGSSSRLLEAGSAPEPKEMLGIMFEKEGSKGMPSTIGAWQPSGTTPCTVRYSRQRWGGYDAHQVNWSPQSPLTLAMISRHCAHSFFLTITLAWTESTSNKGTHHSLTLSRVAPYRLEPLNRSSSASVKWRGVRRLF